MTDFCLEVSGPFACFTRPEMKGERVSYDIVTPSAARSVFEAILWKPQIRWHIRKIEVLKPVRWINLRRNEIGSVISTSNVQQAMNAGKSDLAIYIEEDRLQRAGLFLRDVAYRLHAKLEILSSEEHAEKYIEIFRRRSRKGQCVNQPYLGCREFSAAFKLVEDLTKEPTPEVSVDGNLGWMLYDMDFSSPAEARPKWFQAQMKRGVLDLTKCEVRG